MLPLQGGAPAGLSLLLRWTGSIDRGISAWLERSKQRHALAELDDHLLRDVGLSRSAARREAAKSFWER
jgi:uncharacterized protein YjiS (DUF1127 family)